MYSNKMELILKLLGIGWFVGICIVAGAFIGFWIDDWLSVAPVFTVLGVIIGVFVAIIGMLRMLMAVLTED